MFRGAIVGAVALGFLTASAQAVFVGTIDFEDGTVGELSKGIQVSNPQGHTVGDFGGIGDFELNLAASGTGGFQSKYLVVDSSGVGTGDVYGDVTISALYKPSNDFEFAVAGRVQELTPGGAPGGVGSKGWGIWATPGVDSFANPFNIAYEPPTSASASVRTGTNLWDNNDTIVMSTSTWYSVSLTFAGSTAIATLIELDSNFVPVTGHTATISYTDTLGEMDATGFVGTRGAQVASNTTGYLVDNFTVVPEPASVALLSLGAIGLLRRRRRIA